MEMIKSWNQSSHTYNQETAEEIYSAVSETYAPDFFQLQQKLNSLKEAE